MLLSLALVLFIGMILGRIFEKTNLPSLIGYLITGIILGPYALNVLDCKVLGIASEIKEISLLIILIQAGLSLEIADFKKMGYKAILMSFVPACFEIVGTFIMAQFLFGFNPIDALLLGAIIASASPAVLVPRMLRLMKEGYGVKKGIPQLLLVGDSIDDVFNIVVFSSILGLQSSKEVSFISFAIIPLSILIGIRLGFLIGYLLSKLMLYIQEEYVKKTVILLGVGFILLAIESAVENFFPFSALICVMTVGVALLRLTPMNAIRISSNLSKMWMIAQIYLFALVGATVNFSLLIIAGAGAIVLLVIVLVIRALGILLCLIHSGFTWKEKLFCTLNGIPKATVQAAIGGIPLAMGIASGEMILAISVVAILFTAPVGAFLIDRTYKKLLTTEK